MAASTSIIMRVEMDKQTVTFGEVATAIGNAGGDIIAIDVIQSGITATTRDITVNIPEALYQALIQEMEALAGVKVVNVSDRTFLVHLGGKLEISPKMPIQNREDLSRVYTPGVARVCTAIKEEPDKAFNLTIKRNSVAVVSDGTAVLGLGDMGPKAAMPVMEGKAMLFKQLADIDAYPICLDAQDSDEIVRTIKALSPGFGGINLEDINSPRCFEIEERLKKELDIPVFHDDQHGTAVVMLAGLINALKITNKSMEAIRVVILGVGAAGVACSKMLLAAGVKDVIAVDREGALVAGKSYNHPIWEWLSERTNPDRIEGDLSEVIQTADVFVGVAGPGLLTVEDIRKMAANPIVFAMANPDPEIHPGEAEGVARVMATGRSDYPNQVNNVLCFPGIFRGALDCRATTITEEMKVAAARAIASTISDDELNEHYIIPSVFNDKVVHQVRHEVIQTAINQNLARRIPPEFRNTYH